MICYECVLVTFNVNATLVNILLTIIKSTQTVHAIWSCGLSHQYIYINVCIYVGANITCEDFAGE